jgi:pimeloyl-ACP methyl ester carboxylesterase
VPGAYLANLRAQARNHRKAEELAQRVARYQAAYPDRPVVLVGHSGGGAMAVWIAEAMPPGRQLDGIVLLAASLSPGYALDAALRNCRRGIVSFHSHKDWVFLGAGTIVSGTMDGQHTSSAGMVGFDVPGTEPLPAAYRKLFQIAWHAEMVRTGHAGGHLTSAARPFVARYVAPLVQTATWDPQAIDALLEGVLGAPVGCPTGGR